MKTSSFGPALRAVLLVEGITPAELARRTRMDPGNVSTMLSGKGREPTLPTLRKIVRAMPDHVDIRELILREDIT